MPSASAPGKVEKNQPIVSDNAMRYFGRFKKRDPGPNFDEKGSVLVFVALAMVTILGSAGLAIDLGRGYLLKAHLSRAVDAAALAAARSLRAGRKEAETRGRAIAAANGVRGGNLGRDLSFRFGKNNEGEQTVSVVASQSTPTLLMRVLGEERMDVASAAVATVPPLDLVLVLDKSGSLDMAHAWDDLQEAARRFVRHFDDEIDQMGMVSFQIRATHHFQIQQPFTGKAISSINAMSSIGYTNTGEGLRLAFEQFQGPEVRDRAAKVVVFFTDGRPTAFRGKVPDRDRVLAGWSSPNVAGYWDNPDDLPMDSRPPPDGCAWVPTCFGHDRSRVFDQAGFDGAYWADRIRAEGILVYTIGLGDTSQPPGSILQPDIHYLRLLANVDGMSDPGQPRGNSYFAPTAAQLRGVFNQVAQDLLARLTQ